MLTPKELETVFSLRKAMVNMNSADMTEQLISQIIATKNNEEFIEKMQHVLKNR